jgi:Glycosyl transferases group 1
MAADVIVNKFGFKDYRLEVYGNLDRTPVYTGECQELIASKSLREYVSLKGYGKPHEVFQRTWVFLNSSLSEGLPLAIGEAALAGAPIVCTDVGATFRVVTDPDNPNKRLGAVVAPNDPNALARAQIAMLAVMDEWQEYAEDTEICSPTPDVFTPEDVERITSRMYEKQTHRQILGSQLRNVVKKSFSGDRYLREHEQMLWLGKHLNEARRERTAKEKHQSTIDMMLDDGDLRYPWEDYRPEFLRHVTGFSAINSLTSGFYQSGLSETTTSFLGDAGSNPVKLPLSPTHSNQMSDVGSTEKLV